jgi:hypothetical protein
MPDFNVIVTLRLEVGASLTVKAKDEETATEKVQKMIDEGKIGFKSWEGMESKGVEYDEADQTIEIDSVDEE